MKNILAIIFISFLICPDIIAGNFLQFHLNSDSLKTKSDSAKIISNKTGIDSAIIKKRIFLTAKGLLDSIQHSYILSKNKINKTDYRHTGNILAAAPFTFLNDAGIVGQPSEIFIYGQGYNNISFLNDGINFTNRLTNSNNIYEIQTEGLDKIEIVPLPEGFIYSTSNNPVSFNFIPSNFIDDVSYTRIRVIQAPYQEGSVDGIFNAALSKRISVFGEISNQAIQPRYENTDFSSWQATFRLRYIFSEKVNLISSYNFSNIKTQLYGGIDYDSVKNSYGAEQVNEVIYNNLLAPVKFSSRYHKLTNHNLSFRLLANILDKSTSSLTFYYQNHLSEFRQNDTSNRYNLQNGIKSIINDNRFSTFGFTLDQPINYDDFKLRALAGYETHKFESPLIPGDTNINTYWLGAVASIGILDESITPKIFLKTLNSDGNNFIGYGAGLNLILFDSINFYSGFSHSEKPRGNYLITAPDKNELTNAFEISFDYASDYSKYKLGFFSIAHDNYPLATLIESTSSEGIKNESIEFFKTENILLNGLNFSMDFNLWKISAAANINYYISEDGRKTMGLPNITASGGLYYIDTLFNSNLKLKAGFNFYLIGERNFSHIDYQKNISSTYTSQLTPTSLSYPVMNTSMFTTDYQVDFFMAAQIQDNAIIYFTLENLFDNKYMIIPFYPMPERGMRFGVAWEFFD